jgi:hypothetical protein
LLFLFATALIILTISAATTFLGLRGQHLLTAFRGNVKSLFAFKAEPAGRDSALIELAFEGTAAKWT